MRLVRDLRSWRECRPHSEGKKVKMDHQSFELNRRKSDEVVVYRGFLQDHIVLEQLLSVRLFKKCGSVLHSVSKNLDHLQENSTYWRYSERRGALLNDGWRLPRNPSSKNLGKKILRAPCSPVSLCITSFAKTSLVYGIE